MILEIKTVADVETFFKDLLAEGVNYHPDDNFNIYINGESGKPTYTDEESEIRNGLSDQAFDICEKAGVDIYDLCQEIFLKGTGLDKFIPLPSSL